MSDVPPETQSRRNGGRTLPTPTWRCCGTPPNIGETIELCSARRRDGQGRDELGRRPSDAAAEAVRRLVVRSPDGADQDQDAGDDDEAAHPPDDACALPAVVS